MLLAGKMDKPSFIGPGSDAPPTPCSQFPTFPPLSSGSLCGAAWRAEERMRNLGMLGLFHATPASPGWHSAAAACGSGEALGAGWLPSVCHCAWRRALFQSSGLEWQDKDTGSVWNLSPAFFRLAENFSLPSLWSPWHLLGEDLPTPVLKLVARLVFPSMVPVTEGRRNEETLSFPGVLQG